MKMPFGKYQSVELSNVPRSYLSWLRRQRWVGTRLVKAIDDILDGGPAGQPEAVQEDVRTVRAGERNLIGAFSIRQSGNVGQEILNQDGKVIAWTTDEWTAQVICKLLNENEELVQRPRLRCP